MKTFLGTISLNIIIIFIDTHTGFDYTFKKCVTFDTSSVLQLNVNANQNAREIVKTLYSTLTQIFDR